VINILTFDEAGLRDRLSQLSARSAVVFALLCANRLACSLEYFKNIPDSTKAIIGDASAAVVSSLKNNDDKAAIFEEILLDISPSEEEDPSFEGAVVEDVCAALVYTIRALTHDAPKNAAFAARRVYEAADRYASIHINDSEYSDSAELIILSNPVVQCELQRQGRDFGAVAGAIDAMDLAVKSSFEAMFSPHGL